MVEATGLEPAASWSQTKHSTKLSYASIVDVTAQRNSSSQCALLTVCHPPSAVCVIKQLLYYNPPNTICQHFFEILLLFSFWKKVQGIKTDF
jgi:hypothetical protein